MWTVKEYNIESIRKTTKINTQNNEENETILQIKQLQPTFYCSPDCVMMNVTLTPHTICFGFSVPTESSGEGTGKSIVCMMISKTMHQC